MDYTYVMIIHKGCIMQDGEREEEESNAEKFMVDIMSRIKYHIHENDLNVPEIVGVLELAKQEVVMMASCEVLALELEDEDEDDEKSW